MPVYSVPRIPCNFPQRQRTAHHAVSGGQPEYIPLLGQAPVATKLRAVLKELVAVQSALAVRTVEPASPVADSPFHFSGIAFLFRPFEVSKVENTRISRNLDAHSPWINRASSR